MEPYQKYVTKEHPGVKKTLIGLGGQKNSPPFTQKPSYKRSKSAPPIEAGMIGENSMEKDPTEGIESMNLDQLLDEREYLGRRLFAIEQRIEHEVDEWDPRHQPELEEVYQPFHQIPPKAPQRLT